MMHDHECTCHPGFVHDTLIPQIAVITDVRRETPDVKTFRVERPEGGKLFEHLPGQCAMVCVPGVGEAMFSITSSPTNKLYQEFSIKMCGTLTEHLHSLEVGDQITVRGPYGNNFPVEGPDTADRFAAFQAYCISFRCRQYVADDITAVVNAGMGRPTRRIANIRVFRKFI